MEREFESFGVPITIKQGAGEIGLHVWDGALVLSKYFENVEVFPPTYFRGKRVLELGSGTGFVGIVVARLGAEVTFTDLAPMLPLIEENVKSNLPTPQKHTIAEHSWGTDMSSLKPPFDFVVMSDPLYIPETFPLLVQSLRNACDNNTLVIMSQELRTGVENQFFKMVVPYFRCEWVPNTQLDELFQSDDIVVMRMTLHKDGPLELKSNEQEQQQEAEETDKTSNEASEATMGTA